LTFYVDKSITWFSCSIACSVSIRIINIYVISENERKKEAREVRTKDTLSCSALLYSTLLCILGGISSGAESVNSSPGPG
jgi:uncharacterized membrane protein